MTKKIVNSQSIVQKDVPFVYDNCIDILQKSVKDFENTKVLNEKGQEKIRGFWHQLAGNIGNKILSVTMNDDDLETKSIKLKFLANKASEKTLEVNQDIVKILENKKVPNDVASKTSAVCASDVFERHKTATQETVLAVFEKQELQNFKTAGNTKEKVAAQN